jgi:hypothetical protein
MANEKRSDELLELTFKWQEIIEVAAEIGAGADLAEELLVRRRVPRKRAQELVDSFIPAWTPDQGAYISG